VIGKLTRWRAANWHRASTRGDSAESRMHAVQQIDFSISPPPFLRGGPLVVGIVRARAQLDTFVCRIGLISM